MIISASIRTDIPALYSEWFMDKIQKGFVQVPNPFYPSKIKKVSLKQEDVEAIIFWTKNPIPIMKYLDSLSKYKMGFQITITSYGKDVEPNVPNKREIIEAVKELSNKIGKEKIVLRYDPIFLSSKYTIEYHINMFEKLLNELSSYVSKVVISFIDMYKNTLKNNSSLKIIKMEEKDIYYIAEKFGEISRKYNIPIQTCAEKYNFSNYGFKTDACISNEYINNLTQSNKKYKKARKRKYCNCIETVDIGMYNSCKHLCKYCYANYNEKEVNENFNKLLKEIDT